MKRFRIICMTLLLFLLAGCTESTPPVTLTVSGENFTISNAEGKTLQHSGGAFSGSMIVNGQQSADSGQAGLNDRYYLEVAGSGSFSCQWEAAGSYRFGLLPRYSLDGSHPDSGELYAEYTVSGDCLEHVSITAEGGINAVSEKNGFLTAAFSLPCDALGAHGYASFSGAADGDVSVQPNGAQNQFSFSGFLPGDCVLSYTGTECDPWITVALEVGSGTLDLSRVAEGQITIQEDGREARVLGKAE